MWIIALIKKIRDDTRLHAGRRDDVLHVCVARPRPVVRPHLPWFGYRGEVLVVQRDADSGVVNRSENYDSPFRAASRISKPICEV